MEDSKITKSFLAILPKSKDEGKINGKTVPRLSGGSGSLNRMVMSNVIIKQLNV
jgi:hypothetical protein